MAEIADLDCAKIQTIAVIKDPAIPTAAKASVGLVFKLPTMAVSVIDNKGSAIPAIIAGKANLLIFENEKIEFFSKDLNMFTIAKIEHKKLIQFYKNVRFKIFTGSFYLISNHRDHCWVLCKL